jgi:phosphoribosylformimino-5-aminoimidazole carboxamide ribonucleotide (ProFAR) isomerase
MEKHTVTVYIEGRSYQITITVNEMVHETTYEVITSGNILKDFSPEAEEVIPEYISWQEDSVVRPERRLKMVESEQIARIIWTDILDMMER